MEGTTYESGIGLNNEHAALVQSLLEEKDNPQPEMEQWKPIAFLLLILFLSLERKVSVSSSTI